MNKKAMVCIECWNAACRKALEDIKAKCGVRVEEAVVPERYRSGYKEAE